MKLQEIDKSRYRKHLNMIIAALIVSLMVMALSFGQILIMLLGGDGDHFIFNLSGVLLAGGLCLWVLHRYRQHEFMTEVVYVWELKQGLNKIYRKLRKIEAAKEDGDVNALVILNFYYAASSQLFKLDDNTITMDSLQLEVNKLQQLIEDKGLTIKIEDYSASMLKAF